MPDFVGYPEPVSGADEELVRQARERLVFARKFRRENREAIWSASEDQYEGKHWPKSASDDPAADLITVNVSFSTVNTIMPFITSEEPRFLVEPYSLDALISRARLQQAWLNRYWRSREAGAQEALTLAVGDFLIYGDGFLKETYLFSDKQTGPDTFVDVARIFTDRVSPWDIWIDPNADGLHNARYVFHRLFLTRAEMEQDEERYGDVDLDQLPWGNVTSEFADSDFNQEESIQGENDWMEIFEYYDITSETQLTFSADDDSPLLRKQTQVQPPLVQLPNYRIPRSPYHMGELEQIAPLQHELNKARSELATHRRRNIAKYFVREDVIGPDGLAALQSPIVGEAILVKSDVPLDDVVRPAHVATLPGEAYASADQALRDVYEITGVNEYLRGAAPEIRRTATEASIIEGASNVKVQAKLQAVELAAREAGTIILAIAKSVFPETDTDEMGLFLTGDEANRALRAAAGEETQGLIESGAPPEEIEAAGAGLEFEQQAELRPTEEMFIGEYEVFVESNSTELRNPVFKEQKFREMAQALTGAAPALQQLGMSLNLRKVYELWFEAAGVSDIEGMFEEQQPPQVPAGQPGLGGPPGAEQLPGVPNLAAAEAPLDGITPDNSGALPQVPAV